MSLYLKLFSISLFSIIFSCFLLVIFGQVTVRRLRKNQKLKDKLGIEFISGYDIVNVASALTTQKWFRDKLKDSQLSFLSADYQALYEVTKPYERVLARVFWISLVTSTSFILILILWIIFLTK